MKTEKCTFSYKTSFNVLDVANLYARAVQLALGHMHIFYTLIMCFTGHTLHF